MHASQSKPCFLLSTFEKCRDLEIRVKGHSSSSRLTRIDPPPMTSYYRSIVTMDLSRTVSEIDGDFSQTPSVYFTLPLMGFPLEIRIGMSGQKTRMMELSDG